MQNQVKSRPVSLDMDGPFPLTVEEVGRHVSWQGPGNYALGLLTREGRFMVRYVGRSDDDLRAELMKAARAGGAKPGLVARLMGKEQPADHFKVSFAQDADAAYSKHCRTYHSFNTQGRLDNRSHPKRPAGALVKCPVCGDS